MTMKPKLLLVEDDQSLGALFSLELRRSGYDVERSVQVGAGALLDRWLPWPALQCYLERWPADRLYLDYCDDVVGILSPSARVDLGYRVLEVASAPGRIWTSPGAAERRAEMARRALQLRG